MAKTMKDNKINKLDLLFRQGLGDAETRPPSASWAQMEALLDAQPKQKKRVAAWWWAAAAAVLPLLLAGIWWMTKPQNTDPQMAETKPKTTEQIAKTDVKPTANTDDTNTQLKEENTEQLASSNQPQRMESQEHSNSKKSFKSSKNQPLATNALIATTHPEPKTFVIEPPMPLPDDWKPPKTEVVDNDDNMIASIEYKPGKPSKTNDDEVASIEFKPNQDKKRTFSEQFNKLRNSEINLPTIGDAKQNLFALLSHNK